jgi:uncharacterized membrane protein YkvA (DUF1232 family)
MEENVKFEQYEKHYNEESFWEKVKKFATKAGGKVIYTALKLYFALQSSNTPVWAKSIIVGALGYFVLPIDLIPDVVPAVGFTDDLGVLLAAVAAVAVHITPEIKEQAKKQLRNWFGDSEIAKIED